MTIRIGVDVGGTFTKAVACEPDSGRIVARCVLATTHRSASGVADGVARAVSDVARQVAEQGLGEIELVAHSTTQAVNALLEGDTATVGIIGMGRRPDLKRAAKRTQVGNIRLAPGRSLHTRHTFLDVTGGVDAEQLRSALASLIEAGAEVICASEAFGVEGSGAEQAAREVAADMGMPACSGNELTGLYGLEMRTVTAALNASILPTALRTAEIVGGAVRADVGDVPLLVMRGDGGAVDLEAMKHHPLLTAFSGPAASVAGALHHLEVTDGIIIEVGGTSTNVSAIKGGRPVLAYVRVLDHMTCVRSLDVRVVGVAGGSMVRLGRRLGKARVEDVGPRSAHIAGLTYSCFLEPEELEGARPELISPRPGDPPEYIALVLNDGRRAAPTLTCAANLIGAVPDGAYAAGNRAAALKAFELVADLTGGDAIELARRVVALAAGKVAAAVEDLAREQMLARPEMVGVGGGAGALVPAVAGAMGFGWHIPPDAEVISSVGDALSLVRVEIERTVPRNCVHSMAAVHREAEALASAAGASPASLQIESSAVPERHALRVVALGSVALEADAGKRQFDLDGPAVERVAERSLGGPVELLARNSFYAVFTGANGSVTRFAVIDRHGSLALEGEGEVFAETGPDMAIRLAERVPALTRHLGPISVAPALRLIRGMRLIDLTLFSAPEPLVEAALAECALANGEPVVALLARS